MELRQQSSPALLMVENNIAFTHSPFWVQLWGLLFELMSKEIGHGIGGKVICKVVIYNYFVLVFIPYQI